MLSNKLLKLGSEILKKNNIKTYCLDSEVILSSLTGKPREKFLLDTDIKLNPYQISTFKELIYRRALKKEQCLHLTSLFDQSMIIGERRKHQDAMD